MKIAAYVRVSTLEQAENGHGLDIQRAAIRKWAKQHGHRVVAWCEDAGVSGAKPATERDGLTTALMYLRDHTAGGLVVRDLDRLARSVTVQEAVLAEVWSRAEGYVFTTTGGEVLRDDEDDPMRIAMRKVAGVFHELDRLVVVKRLRDGRAAKAARGGHAVGAYAYGYGPAGPVPVEQSVLAHMRVLRASGQSTRAIAAALTAAGTPTKRGGAWSSPVVARILARTDSTDTKTREDVA